jgi:hypothetical protein
MRDWKIFSDEKNILIYQMGKVGSTSLEETIPGSIHVHSLYGNWPCHVFFEQRRKGIWRKIRGAAYDAFRRIALHRRKKIRIITLVRDVHTRNVSMYFQNLQHWLYKYAEKYKYDNRFESMQNLYDAFEKVFDHDYALEWFDKEIKNFTGIDIFKHEFDKEKGWLRIDEGKYDILIIKLEKLNELWNVVEDYAGVQLELKTVNNSEDKWYNSVYKKFVETYEPNQDHLDKLYSSKLMQHFYTKKEIEKLRNKATRNYVISSSVIN